MTDAERMRRYRARKKPAEKKVELDRRREEYRREQAAKRQNRRSAKSNPVTRK
jgi:hypothetical protein